VTASLNGYINLACRFKLSKVSAAKDQAYAALSFADQDGVVEQSKYDVQNCQTLSKMLLKLRASQK
jgi:hypothetical protein